MLWLRTQSNKPLHKIVKPILALTNNTVALRRAKLKESVSQSHINLLTCRTVCSLDEDNFYVGLIIKRNDGTQYHIQNRVRTDTPSDQQSQFIVA